MFKTDLQHAILLAGLTQLAIAASSLAIPKALRWREQTARLLPLTRQVFWTYASYIFGTNVAFGILSVLIPKALLDGSTLAVAVTSFIALYWTARVTLQLTVFDRSLVKGPLFRAADLLYTTAFAYLGVVYTVAALHNSGWSR